MSNSTEDTTTKVPELTDICNQLTAADFTLAQLALDLKDPDKRQEIGIRLVEAMQDAATKNLEFTDIKLKTKAGLMTVAFKFPIASLVKSITP